MYLFLPDFCGSLQVRFALNIILSHLAHFVVESSIATRVKTESESESESNTERKSQFLTCMLYVPVSARFLWKFTG